MMRWLISCAMLLACSLPGYSEDCTKIADKELRVFCNNVGIFPAFIRDRYPEKLKEKKRRIIPDEEERAAAFAKALIAFEGDPDVVLLQEIWSLKARDVLLEDLNQKYPFCEHPPAMGLAPYTTQQAGLMIFSKYELSGFAFKAFTKGIGIDKLSQKGIAGAWLMHEGKRVAVFTTHLQAGGKRDPSVKPDQLRECNEFIRSFTEDGEEVIKIIAGDFNIDSTNPDAYNKIFQYLIGAKDSYKAGCSPLERTGRYSKDPKKRIDYLLTFDGVEALSTIVDPAGDTVSDHLAVFGVISLD